MQAIKSVGSVLAPYDSDQMIPVYGFGARLPPTGDVSHCFPLTFNEQRPEVHGVQVRAVHISMPGMLGILTSFWSLVQSVKVVDASVLVHGLAQ